MQSLLSRLCDAPYVGLPSSGWLQVELRHLRYLVAVADATTFSGAAQRVGVAQPALTRQLRELERELGAPLFVTGARRATLTPAGEAAVQAARQVREKIGDAVERVRLAQRGLAGRCVICVSKGPMLVRLPARLAQLARVRCPAVTIEFLEGEFNQMWNAVADSVADIGLGQAPALTYPSLHSETQARLIVNTALLVADHPLARRRSIKLKSLHGYSFVWVDTPDNQSTAYAMARDEVARRGQPAQAMRAVESTNALTAIVQATDAWSVIPDSLSHSLPLGLVGIPIEDLAMPVRFSRLWRRADQRPVTLTILELLRVLEHSSPEEDVALQPEGKGDATFVPPRLELRHLRTFVRVVDAGSVGRAAEDLGVTQPALSRQLRDLEHDVGVQLLDRGTRGATPTVAGESLYKDAQELLAAADGIKATVERAERGTSGRCILGAGPVPLVQALVRHAVRYASANEDSIDVVVRDLAWPKTPRALKDAEVDIALGWGPRASRPVAGLRRVVIAGDPLDTALLPARHPLAVRKSVRLEELASTPFLFVARTYSSVIYDRVMVAFAEHHFTPRIDATYGGLHTTWTMVAGGMGWCLMGHSLRTAPPPGTIPVPIEDLSVPWDVEMVYRRDESRACVLAVIEAVQSVDVKNIVVPPPAFLPAIGATSKAAIS